MAKRANPYIEDFVTKSKIHVGMKQFNNNEERLQEVYEKTLELLYKGAKTSHIHESLNLSETRITNKSDKMKQLFIGKDCSLLHSGTVVDIKISKQCKCGTSMESQCAYCEVPLCSNCQQSCAQCMRTYCTRCTLTGSEATEICYSCYS